MRGHIIIITPGFRRSLKIPLGRTFRALVATPVLGLMFGLAYMAATFPEEIHEADYARLVEENRALQTEKENAAVQAGRISMSIVRMEQLSNRISAEIASD